MIFEKKTYQHNLQGHIVLYIQSSHLYHNLKNFSPNIKNLNKYFEYKNYLDYDKDEMTGCKERYVLEGYVDRFFFKNQMKIVYYNDEYKQKGLNTYCSNAMTIMKIPMKNYFRLGIEDSLNSVIDKITLGIIESSLNDENVTKYSIACKENLRLNLLRYFEIGHLPV